MTMPDELAPDLEAPDVDVGAADVGDDAADDNSYADDLAETLAEAGGDASEATTADFLRQAFDEQRETGASADAEAAWRKELDGLVKPHREVLDRVGKGKRHAIRQLFAAENLLRSDPVAGFSRLAAAYTGHLDDARRAEIAQSVLGTLGFETPGAVGQAERARLQQYEAAQRREAAAYQQQLQTAEQTIASFSQGREHFPTVRLTMAALMQSGDAADLSSAYRMACQLRGLTPDAATAAKAASEAQRQSIAKAKAARTPRTSSVPVPAEDEDENLEQKDLLRQQLRQAQAANRGMR